MMRARWAGFAACLAALPAAADPVVLHEQGVTLTVTPLTHEVRFRFQADDDWRIAAGYGIELDAPNGQATLWDEILPKRVEDQRIDYFDASVEMALRRKDAHHTGTVTVLLGACYKKELCTLITFTVRIPGQL